MQAGSLMTRSGKTWHIPLTLSNFFFIIRQQYFCNNIGTENAILNNTRSTKKHFSHDFTIDENSGNPLGK